MAPSPVAPPAGRARYTANLQAFVFAIFFAFGGITSLNDVIIPRPRFVTAEFCSSVWCRGGCCDHLKCSEPPVPNRPNSPTAIK